MLEDVLLITEKHQNAAAKIVDLCLDDDKKQPKKEKMIIAISGESGSGKSELAHEVAKLLNKNHNIVAKTLHTDNFYNTLPKKRRAWREKKGIDKVVGYNEYLWDEIKQVFKAFKKGKKVFMPCVDLITEQVDILGTNFRKVDMLVVDGLYAIKAKQADLRFYINLTYLETKTKHTKDIRGKEVMDEGRWATLEQEHKIVTSLKPTADYLITPDFDVVENPEKEK
ncbi:MAG: zeta toxin family protein [Bacteroidales bacterium]|nr:zeta toxin family protein [Bacteroidales bacterium]